MRYAQDDAGLHDHAEDDAGLHDHASLHNVYTGCVYLVHVEEGEVCMWRRGRGEMVLK